MTFLSISLCFLLFLFIQSVSSQNALWTRQSANALTPPRGWNSYPSFSWTISEEEFLQSADALSRTLLDSGYVYAVVDADWHRSIEGETDSIDEWGRIIPDPARWPSSVNGRGFTEVAHAIHSLRLKFGIQVKAGIHIRAVDQNTPILDVKTGIAYQENGKVFGAADIAIRDKPCSYAPSFVAINPLSNAGKAFLKSIYDIYSSWGVDFVKLDCVFGDHLNMDEIMVVSTLFDEYKEIILSVSPGVAATLDMGKQVSSMVNMYRVTPNNWDQWNSLENHFDVARDFANAGLIGQSGLKGFVWPDLDTLPFGWLTDPDSKQGPHRESNLTHAEQTTEITLWSIAKSPIIFGGDLRKLDLDTQMLLTNPTLYEINVNSSHNKEFQNSLGPGIRSWIATGIQEQVYVAIFNLNEEAADIKMESSSLSVLVPEIKSFSTCNGTDVWSDTNKVANGVLSANLRPHACSLFVLNCS